MGSVTALSCKLSRADPRPLCSFEREWERGGDDKGLHPPPLPFILEASPPLAGRKKVL